MEYVAYYRVSTDRQGASGLGLDAQRAAVARHIGAASSPLAEFTEIESGRKHTNRPQLLAALDTGVWGSTEQKKHFSQFRAQTESPADPFFAKHPAKLTTFAADFCNQLGQERRWGRFFCKNPKFCKQASELKCFFCSVDPQAPYLPQAPRDACHRAT